MQNYRSSSRLTLGLPGLALLALGLGALGCTHQPDPTGPEDAGLALTAAQRGEAVAKKYSCGSCHNPESAAAGVLSGQLTPRQGTMAYGANLTPDPDTGIADWTDAQILTAVRTGVDDEGEQLCPTMPRFTNLSDSDGADLVAYLRSLKPVNRMIPESTCPPIKPIPMMDGGTHD
jgi:cytochrome c553